MPKPNATHPAVGKGVSFPFNTAIVAWVDLLGYGSMIADARFNPLDPKAAIAIRRLRSFHASVADHSKRAFPTLVMNDGAVAYRDLSMRSRSVTHEFIVNAWHLFRALKSSETREGFPGPRMVIATGFRMRGRKAGIDQTAGKFASLMERFQAGAIGAEQAIREASRISRTFDIVPHLQANFAFTKAYVAEGSGSKGGLAGASCFLDLAVFEPAPHPWIKLGNTVDWTDARLSLSAGFAPILDVPPWKHVEGGPAGLRDGLQIAQALAGDQDVLAALRAARRSEPDRSNRR